MKLVALNPGPGQPQGGLPFVVTQNMSSTGIQQFKAVMAHLGLLVICSDLEAKKTPVDSEALRYQD